MPALSSLTSQKEAINFFNQEEATFFSKTVNHNLATTRSISEQITTSNLSQDRGNRAQTISSYQSISNLAKGFSDYKELVMSSAATTSPQRSSSSVSASFKLEKTTKFLKTFADAYQFYETPELKKNQSATKILQHSSTIISKKFPIQLEPTQLAQSNILTNWMTNKNRAKTVVSTLQQQSTLPTNVKTPLMAKVEKASTVITSQQPEATGLYNNLRKFGISFDKSTAFTAASNHKQEVSTVFNQPQIPTTTVIATSTARKMPNTSKHSRPDFTEKLFAEKSKASTEFTAHEKRVTVKSDRNDIEISSTKKSILFMLSSSNDKNLETTRNSSIQTATFNSVYNNFFATAKTNASTKAILTRIYDEAFGPSTTPSAASRCCLQFNLLMGFAVLLVILF